jgi:alpha-L-fucosidase 2
MGELSFGPARFKVSSDYIKGHDIVYVSPACDWIDGLNLGNGDIGVMVYGSPNHMKFSLNKSDVWDYRCEQYWLKPEFRHSVIAKAIEERDWGKYLEVTKECNEFYEKFTYPSLQPCGQLEIKMDEIHRSFHQRLSLQDALIETNFILDVPGLMRCIYTYRPCTVTCFVDAVRNVFVLDWRFKGQPPERPIGFSKHPELGMPLKGVVVELYRQPNEELPKPSFGFDDECVWMSFTFPDGFRYVVLFTIDGPPYKVEKTDDKVTVKFDGRVSHFNLYLSITTSKEAEDPLEVARREVLTAKSMGFEKLLEEHRDWWRGFWSKSFISLPDKLLENLWYKSIYDIASCSRDKKTMPGLQGLWCIDNFPAWHADYHLDANVQMLYWPVYTANHPELAEPLYHTFTSMLPQIKEDTKRHYNLDGACIPMTTCPTGVNVGGWFPCAWWPMAGAWLCQHFWWGYTFTKDVKFLREVAYPFMKECAKFYEGYLKRDGKGRIVIFPSHSPEVGGYGPEAWGRNATCDIALMKYFFKAMIEASEILGVDEEEREKWRDILNHLPEYPLVDGHLIDMEWRSITQSRDPWTADGIFFLLIHPLGEIGLDSPEEWLEIGRNSYKYIRVWHVWKACVAARLGLKDEALKQLYEFVKTIGPNGMNTHNFVDYSKILGFGKLYQIDCNGAFAAAINEMLLQSHNKVIRVFPATPDEWRNVRFAHLRAEGAFLVSSEMEDGAVKYVIIESLAGGICRIINPFPGSDLLGMRVGVRVRDLNTGKTIDFKVQGNMLLFETEPEHAYVVERPEKPLESFKETTLTPPEGPRLGIGRFHFWRS